MSEAESSGPTALPNVGDLIAEVETSDVHEIDLRVADERRFGSEFDRNAVEAEVAWANLSGLQDHYKFKGHWSVFLMVVLGSMTVFQWLLLVMVGFGLWDFTSYDWLLPALLVQNLGQIIGLAFIVVKSLFR
jgi:hypothetical protein